MNEGFCNVPDLNISGTLFSLCLSVLLSTITLRTLVVLVTQLLRSSKHLKKKTNKTFDNVRWMLTMTWVAPECRDAGGLARLCRDTRLMRIFAKTREKKGTRDGSSLAALDSMRLVALHRRSLGSFH
jgi:hypothetical protein